MAVADQLPTGQPMLHLSEEFMRLFALNQRRIYGYIVTLLPRHADAEEVLQQTNLILWRRFEEFRADADFIRWAFGIARNEVRRYLRDRSRRMVTLDDDMLELLAETHVENIDLLTSRRTALSLCISQLSTQDRELIEHCYQGNATNKQVAELIGRPVNTVYKALGRIRRALFNCVHRRLAAEMR